MNVSKVFEGLPFNADFDSSVTLAEVCSEYVTLNGTKEDEKVLSLYASEGGCSFPNVIVPKNLQTERHVYQVLKVPSTPFYEFWWKKLCGCTFSDIMEFLGVGKYQKNSLTPPATIRRRNEGQNSVLSLDWNQFLPIFAVGLRNNTVYFFDLESEKWMEHIILKHDFMEGLVVLKWKPKGCPNDIAVGTAKGVCLWNLQCHGNVGTSDRYNGAFMRFLYDEDVNCGAISSLEWSPDGLLLATARERSSSIIVWDVNIGSHICLKRNGGSGSYALSWSKNGAFLISGGCSNFIIWDTKNWTANEWTCPSGSVQDIYWHPSSLFFYVSVSGTPVFHNFQIKSDLEVRGLLIGDYTGTFGLPFETNSMVWSPCGRRVAVSFKDKSLVGVLESSRANRMYALGYIHGIDEDFGEAEILTFKPFYKKGALLTIVWSCGKISFIPMLIGEAEN